AAWPSPSAEVVPTCPPPRRSHMEQPQTTEVLPTEPDIETRVREEGARGDVPRDRATRFYDRMRTSIREYTEGKRAVGKTAEFLMLVPDMFMLLWRLTTDSRVRGKDKALLGSAVVYFILP